MRGVYCIVTSIAIVLVATLASPMQAHPDFSGRWTLDAPSPAPADVARVLVVDRQVQRPNVCGETRPLVHLHISIRREGPSATTLDTYRFGMTGGLVGPRIDSDDKRAAWRGDTLTLLTRRDDPQGPHTTDRWERRESWSIARDGRLRVEIVIGAHDGAQQTTVLLYRREK